MRTASTLLLAALAVQAVPSSSPGITMNKATPLITVEQVEPCLAFWTESLGFEVTVTVPHKEAIGFAILARGDVELMFQSRASIDADLGAAGGPADLGGELAGSTTALFIEVDDLDAVITALGDRQQVLVPRRQTFYGMDEIFVRAPCGTVVGFAARISDAEAG